MSRVASFVGAVFVALRLGGQQLEPHEQPVRSNDCIASDLLCIRIKNSSDIDFDRFEVRFPEQTEDFGALRAGEVSGYRRIGRAYDHNFTEGVSDGRRFFLVIIDHIGDGFLRPGRYTLRYSAQVLDQPRRSNDFVVHGYLGSELEVDECRLTSSCSGR